MKLDLWKKILPWAVAAGTFYYLFRAYPLDRVSQAFPYMQVVPFLLYSLAYFLFMWIADCWSLARLFSRFGYPTRTQELLTLRLASYAIMIINYGAGQGALAYFFKQRKNAPFFRSSSVVSFTMVVDLYWAVSLAFVGSAFSGFRIDGLNLKSPLWLLWSLLTAGLILLMILAKLDSLGRWLDWLRDRPLFAAFRSAGPADYLQALLLRLPLHLAVNSTLYFVALTFGADIPFLTVITYLPIVLLIGTIPITPGGLGTFQIATVELFKNSIGGEILRRGIITPQELLFLMSLAFQMVNYVLKTVTGVFFFRKVFLYRKKEDSFALVKENTLPATD
jgi:uncharacterized membrane protein YbhN (UPF0104 family)